MTVQYQAHFVSSESIIARQLVTNGYAVVDNYLPGGQFRTLREEMVQVWQSGCFRHAGVGRGENRELQPTIRNDKVLWLEPMACSPAQRRYLATLENLRLKLNQELLLGLFNFEGHMAVYPPGARYQRHLDQFRDMGTRRVSAVLYLNENWTMNDGGALRLYLDNDKLGSYQDIYPYAGRLVTFLSDRFYHEVLPAGRERYSITGWFRQRDDMLAD
ncbi:2OG-Fe(II) oxygenase [Thiohalophilus sp.]|uniref:2OG-Fe(II) oxygenase n=1 Tax=Thiohalophilus sp. TaxID=3028392 RepID=UPI002ACDFC07|nr:2OG-Fe(II) oxygenase [Thiohalophilus sp.]MDZ7661178.1 2OG-Fe(II) oxygenase [Thiohalophilus sp.]